MFCLFRVLSTHSHSQHCLSAGTILTLSYNIRNKLATQGACIVPNGPGTVNLFQLPLVAAYRATAISGPELYSPLGRVCRECSKKQDQGKPQGSIKSKSASHYFCLVMLVVLIFNNGVLHLYMLLLLRVCK